jgi:hypothetical protein
LRLGSCFSIISDPALKNYLKNGMQLFLFDCCFFAAQFRKRKYRFKVRASESDFGKRGYTHYTRSGHQESGGCVCAHRLITGGRGAALLPAGWLPQRCPHCSRTAAVDTEPERLAAPRRKIAPAPPHAKISLPPQSERRRTPSASG